jgi:predicted transcriptional regulator
MPEPTFSDSEWRRLVEAQNKIRLKGREEREKLSRLMQQIAEANARMDRLKKQDDLLRKRAGDFIVREIKEIEELEKLEEERKQKKIEEKEKSRLVTVSNGESSSQAVFDAEAAEAFALPSLSDPFFDQFIAEIPESYQGSSN